MLGRSGCSGRVGRGVGWGDMGPTSAPAHQAHQHICTGRGLQLRRSSPHACRDLWFPRRPIHSHGDGDRRARHIRTNSIPTHACKSINHLFKVPTSACFSGTKTAGGAAAAGGSTGAGGGGARPQLPAAANDPRHASRGSQHESAQHPSVRSSDRGSSAGGSG